MNKEEILEKSRNENRNKDIYELEVISEGQRIGGLVGIAVTLALISFESRALGTVNYGYLLIIAFANAGLRVYKAVKLKKGETFCAVVWSAAAILIAVVFVLNSIR